MTWPLWMTNSFSTGMPCHLINKYLLFYSQVTLKSSWPNNDHKVTVKHHFIDTHLIWTLHYYGQFALSLLHFSKSNPLNKDTPLKRTLSMASSVSVLLWFDCMSSKAVDPYSCTGTVLLLFLLFSALEKKKYTLFKMCYVHFFKKCF